MGYSQLTNNIATVSGEQQKASAIHIHVFILPQTTAWNFYPEYIKQSENSVIEKQTAQMVKRFEQIYKNGK